MGLFIEHPFSFTLFAFVTFAIAAFIKPAFLAGRDYLVWKVVDWYIERSKLEMRAHIYAAEKAEHISLQKEPPKITVFHDGTTRYYIGDKETAHKNYDDRRKRIEAAKNAEFKLQKRLHKESLIIGSALRHYNQEAANPAALIIQHYEEIEFLRRGLEYPDTGNR